MDFIYNNSGKGGSQVAEYKKRSTLEQDGVDGRVKKKKDFPSSCPVLNQKGFNFSM